MRLYLVRHAQYDNPRGIYTFRLPLNLSPKGREQASAISAWFVDRKLRGIAIHSSPIVRAVQTAEILANALGSFVSVDERLIETSCDNLQGTKRPAVDAWRVEEHDPSREDRKLELTRVLKAYKAIVAKGEDSAMVSHGDPLTLLYYYLKGSQPPRYFWNPQNEHLVVQIGQVIEIELVDGVVKSVDVHKVVD